MEVARDFGEFETMRGGQRQDDIVFGCGGLQLEIELAAESFAQGEAPGAVDTAAERRMDDELHAARFVEEALEDDRILRRQAIERAHRGGEIFDELHRRRLVKAERLIQPSPGGLA